jgi:uncharacterized protein (DUF1015 family)
MDGLRLSAFHRRVGPVPRDEVLGVLAHGFRVTPCSAEPAPTPGSFGLYVGGDWFRVHVESSSAERRRRLDVEVLHERVLAPLGRSIEIARAQTSVDELVRLCDEDGGALFTLAPPPLSELTRLADAGEVMPPKTTYFEPKPCAGVFLRAAAAAPAPRGDMLTR